MRRLFYLFSLFLILSSDSHSLERGSAFDSGGEFLSPEEAEKLAEAFELKGLEKFVGDQAKSALIQSIGNQVAQWSAEGLYELIREKQGPKDPELSRRLKDKILEKLEKWIPEQAGKLVQKEIFDPKITRLLNLSINKEADLLFGGWYEKMMERVEKKIPRLGEVSPESLLSLFQGEAATLDIGIILGNHLGDLIGRTSVQGLQSRMLEGLQGELPGEFLAHLKLGPEKFKEYASTWKGYLPAAQFAKAKEKVMGLHLVNLPNRIYGGILASSAAMHVAKAFAGPKINFYELKRAKEVTQTLIWQLKNREYISLNVADFLGMIRRLEDQLGSFHWGALKSVSKWGPSTNLFKQLDHLERKLKKIDALYDKATGKMLKPFEDKIAELEREFKNLSKELLSPLTLKLPCLTPDGCPSLFPEAADLSRWEGFKKLLRGANRKIASGLATASVETAALLKITGPFARILNVEKVPPQNPSMGSDFDPVLLHNGEFYHTVTDVTLPGEKIVFQFTRIYRSASDFLGVLGRNWTHNFAERLKYWASPEGKGWTYVDSEGKKWFFKQKKSGEFAVPPGLFLKLRKSSDGFILIFSDGGERRFDGQGYLRSILDSQGNRLNLSYNRQKQLKEVQEISGKPLLFDYYPSGLLRQIEDFTGRRWNFEYDEEANLISAASPGTPAFPKGKTTRYRYSNHKMILIMDPKGQIYLQNFYGKNSLEKGKVIAQIYGEENASIVARYSGPYTMVKDRMNILHLYEHDSEGHLLNHSILKKSGVWKRLRSYRYDNLGRVQEEVFPSGLKKTTSWEKERLLETALIAANGKKRILEREEGKISADSGGEVFQFDSWGNVIEVIDPKGNRRQFEIDASNLVTKEFRNGESYYYFYDANDNIIRMEVPERKLALQFRYDILDRLVEEKRILDGSQTITTGYEYDSQGRLKRLLYPMGNDLRLDYDEEGNLVRRVRSLGSALEHVEHFEYDEDGNWIAYRNATGEIVRYPHDDFGEPIKGPNPAFPLDPATKGDEEIFSPAGIVHDPISRPVQIGLDRLKWDDNGRLTSVTDAEGEETAYAYDTLDRLVLEKFSNGSERRFQYSAAGRIETMTDRRGILHRYRYDNRGFLISREAGGEIENFVYDKEGRLIEASNKNAKVEFSYDNASRVRGEAINGKWVLKSYNLEGQKVGIRYPSGLQVVRLTDDRGNPLEIFASGKRIADFRYSNEGYLIEEEWGNGIRLNQDFNEKGEMISQKFLLKDSKDSPGWNYFYEEGRLKKAEDLLSSQTEEYRYDSNGDLSDLNPPEKKGRRDLGGNLIQDGSFFYEYDPFNRLKAVRNLKEEIITAYLYDPFGRLVEANYPKEGKGLTYSYDDWQRIEVIENNGAQKSYIYKDVIDHPLSFFDTSKKEKGLYFYHLDRKGSVRFVSNVNGDIVEWRDYHPFGEMKLKNGLGENLRQSQIGDDLGYIGRPIDPITALLDFRYRFYSPTLKEFITPDPLGYKNEFYAPSPIQTPLNISFHQGQGGASRTTFPNTFLHGGKREILDIDLFHAENPVKQPHLETDLFAYASKDPVNFFDPLGLYAIDIELPHWGGRAGKNLRDQYGILMLRKENGVAVAGPFRVLGRSSNSWKDEEGKSVRNKNRNRDPVRIFGDTPRGTYRVEPMVGKGDHPRFGPHPVLPLHPISGDALKAYQNGRRGILIHGGRQRARTSFGDNLVPTLGCVRMHNDDMGRLIGEIRRLRKEEGDSAGVVNISEFGDKGFYLRRPKATIH